MRVLIVGGDGMLGHQLLESLAPSFDVHATFRRSRECYPSVAGTGKHFDVDVEDFKLIADVVARVGPDVVINAVGVVKQRAKAKDAIISLETNSVFPHRLVRACRDAGARLIHVSTDCVFLGSKGGYTQTDIPDARDLYGLSKLLGEVAGEGCITLRTSIIGLELSRKAGLIEWYLAQKGRISGYRKAIYSGFTTLELARIIARVITGYPEKHGLFHVSSDPISKYELLRRLDLKLGGRVEIVPDDAFHCDRSMLSTEFREQFAYTPPSWDEMLDELASQIMERQG